MHCPRCTGELKEITTEASKYIVWWKCVACGEFYQMPHLKKLILTA